MAVELVNGTYRVLRNSGATLEATFYVDGVATDADSLPAFVITRADGSTLTTGTATSAGVATGKYRFVLAPQAELNRLTVTWTATVGGVVDVLTMPVEIVGGFTITLNEMRGLAGLADAGKFPSSTLLRLRREFEDTAETYCKVGFVPRFHRDVLDGNNRTQIQLAARLPTKVLSVTISGTSVATSAFSVHPHGRLEYPTGVFSQPTTVGGNVIVEYEAGYPSPPAKLVRAARDFVRHYALVEQSPVGRDVLSFTDPGGYATRFSTPDWDQGRPTGLLDVDAVLNSLQLRI